MRRHRSEDLRDRRAEEGLDPLTGGPGVREQLRRKDIRGQLDRLDQEQEQDQQQQQQQQQQQAPVPPTYP